MNRLEIALKEANGEIVRLKSMSPEALESFMVVMSSLKALTTSIINREKLTFSITEGSAQCAASAPIEEMSAIYNELDIAMRGESDDKDVTTNLRGIQDQLKRERYIYNFVFRRVNEPPINIHSRLIDSKRIALKRKRNQFEHVLQIKRGFLNQIGGKIPNYHFDYGGGNKITISCTMEEAKSINKFLYQDVDALVLCKEWYKEEKKDEYTHKAIVNPKFVNDIKKYLKNYSKEDDILKKLELTHKYSDNIHKNGVDLDKLNLLLLAFNDINFHLSELKTVLIISKQFKDHEIIKNSRAALNKTYLEKKNKKSAKLNV